MENNNLALTEKAIARHTKRLQKELSKINHELKLSEAQNMLSRILGMKDYHELKQVLKFNEVNNNEPINQDKEEKNFDYYLDINNFITLEYAQKNLEDFFSNGSINIILKFLNSNDIVIQQYIKENSLDYFYIAARNNQLYLLKLLINRKLININLFSEKEIEDLYFHLLSPNSLNLECFNYIFYELNFPKKFSQKLVGSTTHYLLTNNNVSKLITHLNKFFNDDRINFQKNFYWNSRKIFKKDSNNNEIIHTGYDYDYCVLNSICTQGNFDIVKYLIEKQNVSPSKNGSTVSCACFSGNLKLVKYLIEKQNAPFNYFNKNYHKKVSDNDMTYRLDKSTLSSAVQSNNLNVVEYLIKNKNHSVSEHDFLAFRVALIESTKIYEYFFQYPECINYLDNNYQSIFNEVICKIHYFGERNYKNLLENQFKIAKKIMEHYPVKIEKIITTNNNPKLIELLEKNFIF